MPLDQGLKDRLAADIRGWQAARDAAANAGSTGKAAADAAVRAAETEFENTVKDVIGYASAQATAAGLKMSLPSLAAAVIGDILGAVSGVLEFIGLLDLATNAVADLNEWILRNYWQSLSLSKQDLDQLIAWGILTPAGRGADDTGGSRHGK